MPRNLPPLKLSLKEDKKLEDYVMASPETKEAASSSAQVFSTLMDSWEASAYPFIDGYSRLGGPVFPELIVQSFDGVTDGEWMRLKSVLTETAFLELNGEYKKCLREHGAPGKSIELMGLFAKNHVVQQDQIYNPDQVGLTLVI